MDDTAIPVNREIKAKQMHAWVSCGRHHTKFLEGNDCPQCEAERATDEEDG